MILPFALPPVECRIDFSRWEGVPLLKTKFGVYETPFVDRDELVRSLDLVREIGVRDLRYELAWGKPDAKAFDMAGPKGFDFGFIEPFLDRCRTLGIRPLLATGYCPTFLQTRTGWPAWKDVPKDLAAWESLHRTFAERLRERGLAYEVWNEPDMPEGGGKMFFEGSAEDYGRIYRAGESGLRAGDPDATVGGPAAAYDLRYLPPVLAGTADFASIHGYANYPGQIAGMRKALARRPDLPIWLTEYASFNDFRKDGPAVRTEAAAAFFRDADGLLKLTDVTKVYWAQWIDDYLGLMSRDGHRRAIFNAFKLYGSMPTDRVATSPVDGLTVLASASTTQAAVVVANPTDAGRAITLRFDRLPVREGTWKIMRIDRHHASFVDDSTSETLRVDETSPLGGSWSGNVPAHGVVFLGSGNASVVGVPAGRIVGERRRFDDRSSAAYADFDPATWVARLGGGTAEIALETEDLKGFRLDHTRQGPGPGTRLRIEFLDVQHAVVGTRYFGPGGAPLRGIVDLHRLAPPDWRGRRIRLVFVHEGEGKARIALSSL